MRLLVLMIVLGGGSWASCFEGLDRLDPQDIGLEDIDLSFLLSSDVGEKVLLNCGASACVEYELDVGKFSGFSFAPGGRKSNFIRLLTKKEFDNFLRLITDLSNYALWQPGDLGSATRQPAKWSRGFEFCGVGAQRAFVRVHFDLDKKLCFFFTSSGEVSRTYKCSSKLVAESKRLLQISAPPQKAAHGE